MNFTFNADEILEMAVKIEQNGQKFYSSSSELVDDESVKKLLLDLSRWEGQHKQLFLSMRTKFSQQHEEAALFDPDSEAARYLQAIADDKVFNLQTMDEELSNMSNDPKAILNRAIQREKDAIVFFVAIKDIVSASLGAEDVENIIREEYSHIRYLTEKIASL